MTPARLRWPPALALLALPAARRPDYRKPAGRPAGRLEARGAVARRHARRRARPKGPWWQRFGDPRARRAPAHRRCNDSPTLAAARRAAGAGARAASLGDVGAATRRSTSPRARNASSDLREPAAHQLRVAATSRPCRTTSSLSLAVSYEADVSGRVQRSIEGARASAEQSAADLENTRLLLTADLATAYFNLRAIDIELDVLSRSIALQRRSLELVTRAPRPRRRLRPRRGAAAGAARQHAHAGRPAAPAAHAVRARDRDADRHAGAAVRAGARPARARRRRPIPLGVPSDVLERRPDVAAAERAMAAANAQIGVAKRRVLPEHHRSAPSYGYQSRSLSRRCSTRRA